jgi:hypothetical protein
MESRSKILTVFRIGGFGKKKGILPIFCKTVGRLLFKLLESWDFIFELLVFLEFFTIISELLRVLELLKLLELLELLELWNF